MNTECKKINVIKEAKEYLNDKISYYAKEFAKDKLAGYEFMVKTDLKRIMTLTFLLNLVEAHEPCIDKYIIEESQETKGELK